MKMMIMAQHPTHHQQPAAAAADQSQRSGAANQRQPTAAPFNEAFHVPPSKQQQQQQHIKSKSEEQNHHQQQQQRQLNNHRHHSQDDNKRSLIKNQLYLIEQLQLENADLRNERDQLQLENEELKFQLQMISSSNILSQPGNSFNNNPTLVAGGESGPKRQQQQPPPPQSLNGDGSVRKTMATTADCAANNNHTADPAATGLVPLFTKEMGSEQRVPLQQQQVQEDNQIVRSARDALVVDEKSPKALQPITRQQQPPSTTTTCNKSLGCKSASLTAINVKSVASSRRRLSRRNPDNLGDENDDEYDGEEVNEEGRRRFVEQIYGDSEKIQAAAIVIQRAFRKHQICKRFRAITEQLRQARQPSGLLHNQNQPGRKSEPSSPNASTRGRSADGGAGAFAYATGTTRAAAWESLSYAASRLAAAASAKQAENDSSIQQAPKSTNNTNNQVSLNNGHPHPQQRASSRNQQRQQQQQQSLAADARVPLKAADPVVAAAINFQQLESIRKRQYRVGLNIFNKSPDKGISFLIAHSFIDASPPFAKNSSPSFYHSNQLHFIDKQHVLHERTVASLRETTASLCQLCIEGENLKRNIAHFLLHRKGLAKEKIGQYLGNLQESFNQDVLRYYLQELDFNGLQIDLALRKFLSTFRLPGEAQKIERIVDCFAQRYVQCQQLQLAPAPLMTTNNDITQHTIQVQQKQPILATSQQQQPEQQHQAQNTPQYKNNLMFLSKDEIFILTFAIIMLNTDLHSPSLKPTSRMSSQQFVNNLRGVFKSHTINESDLVEIYDRVKVNQITTIPDHVSHVMKVQQGLTVNNFQKKELPNLCVPHRRLVCFCRLFEVYDVTKKERVGQHQREIFLFNDLLLVTKLARRVRANSTQLYTYRQSIPLQGLYVQLFQSQHYLYGIRLCKKSDDETLIMFNARNELDQSRFVDDLSESIAEMDEMETIKVHNLIETIHFRQQERLRRHRMSHATSENGAVVVEDSKPRPTNKAASTTNMIEKCDTSNNIVMVIESTVQRERDDKQQQSDNYTELKTRKIKSDEIPIPGASSSLQQRRGKFSSMLNLSSSNQENDEGSSNRTQAKGLRLNRSFVIQAQQQQQQQQRHADNQPGSHNDSGSSGQRRCSTSSVHSLDSGLFLSRDISPNQSG